MTTLEPDVHLTQLRSDTHELTSTQERLKIILNFTDIVMRHPSLQPPADKLKTQLYSIPVGERCPTSVPMRDLEAVFETFKLRAECHELLLQIKEHQLDEIDTEMTKFVNTNCN